MFCTKQESVQFENCQFLFRCAIPNCTITILELHKGPGKHIEQINVSVRQYDNTLMHFNAIFHGFMNSFFRRNLVRFFYGGGCVGWGSGGEGSGAEGGAH